MNPGRSTLVACLSLVTPVVACSAPPSEPPVQKGAEELNVVVGGLCFMVDPHCTIAPTTWDATFNGGSFYPDMNRWILDLAFAGCSQPEIFNPNDPLPEAVYVTTCPRIVESEVAPPSGTTYANYEMDSCNVCMGTVSGNFVRLGWSYIDAKPIGCSSGGCENTLQ